MNVDGREEIQSITVEEMHDQPCKVMCICGSGLRIWRISDIGRRGLSTFCPSAAMKHEQPQTLFALRLRLCVCMRSCNRAKDGMQMIDALWADRDEPATSFSVRMVSWYQFKNKWKS